MEKKNKKKREKFIQAFIDKLTKICHFCFRREEGLVKIDQE